MNNNHCVACGKGGIEFRKVKNFETMVRGNRFTVPEATIGFCKECDSKVFDPREIRRWQELFDAEEVSQGKFLSAAEVKEIRETLGLQISQFAILLGATRQSVYNWEREKRNTPQLRMVDLLLRLVRESIETGTVDVVQFLSMQAGIDPAVPEARPRCRVGRRPRRVNELRRRESGEFDRVFAICGEPVELPRLSRY
jgi:putative zinc finger/helix-turn-helix YgiT family protein